MGERLFKGILTKVRRSLLGEIRQAERAEQVEGILEQFSIDADMWEAYERFYTRTVPFFARDFLKKYKSGKGPTETKQEDEWIEEILEWVRINSGKKITSVIQTHYEDIQRVTRAAVETGINEGWGMDKIARLISKEQGEIDLWKSLRIARTETVAASNYGVELGADELPGNKMKVWISSFTTTSREDHMAMDGVMVELGQPFDVAGEPLMYPGDPAGSPGNIINCRCAHEVIITDEIY